MPQQNLKGLDREELAAFISGIGEQMFRAEQLFRWIYGRAVASFDEITDSPSRCASACKKWPRSRRSL